MGRSQPDRERHFRHDLAPNASITREQMAAILYRYAQYKGYDVTKKADLSGYSDNGQVSAYAKDALAWANAAKLINGVTNTTLAPQATPPAPRSLRSCTASVTAW